jgi:hypothetical protein
MALSVRLIMYANRVSSLIMQVNSKRSNSHASNRTPCTLKKRESLCTLGSQL